MLYNYFNGSLATELSDDHQVVTFVYIDADNEMNTVYRIILIGMNRWWNSVRGTKQ